MEEALKIDRDMGVEWLRFWDYFSLSYIYLELGDLDEARDAADDALRLSQKNSERHVEGWSRILLGRRLGRTEPSSPIRPSSPS